MQAFQRRCLILLALLVAASLLLAGFDRPTDSPAARWPTDDAVYTVDGWDLGPLTVETAHGVSFVQRAYRRADGTAATLAIATSPEAKRIYRAGADVPLLANGYTVDPAPPSLVPATGGRTALVARRGSERSLVLFGYGERRGILGAGALGWSLVVLDASLGRPNDYYLVRLITRLDGAGTAAVPETVVLAETLFTRLADWYAD